MTSSTKTLLTILATGAVVGAVTVASIQQMPTLTAAKPKAAIDAEVQTRPVVSLSGTSLDALRNMNDSFAQLAEYVAPTVVHIRVNGTSGRDVLGRQFMPSAGVGTGVILRSDGWIVTNDHVVGGMDDVTVVLHDGRELKGKVRRATESDIAVVKVEATGLTAATFANSDQVKPGQFSMAVGSPFGLDNTVTFGHISATGRQREIADPRVMGGGRFYPQLLQTDTPINQGNSGGPLFNIEGQVIGINSAIASFTGGSNGVGFAIPSNFARFLAETLIEKGKVTRGALGVQPDNLKPYELKQKSLDGGAVIVQVENDSPAAKSGLKAQDIVTRIGSKPIRDAIDLRMAMYNHAPGSRVQVEYVRDGRKQNATVQVGDAEAMIRRDLQRVPRGREEGGEGFDALPDEMRDFFRRQWPNENTPNDVPPVREGQARLGVGVEDLNSTNRTRFNVPANVTAGAVVTSVEPGSVADRLGMKVGAVIEKIGDRTIRSAQDVRDAVGTLKWGDKTRVKFGRYNAGTTMMVETDIEFR